MTTARPNALSRLASRRSLGSRLWRSAGCKPGSSRQGATMAAGRARPQRPTGRGRVSGGIADDSGRTGSTSHRVEFRLHLPATPGAERVFDFFTRVFQVRCPLIVPALRFQAGVVGRTPGCRLDLAPDLLQFVPGFIGTAHGNSFCLGFQGEAPPSDYPFPSPTLLQLILRPRYPPAKLSA